MAIRFARSARRHRISRAAVLYVIEHSGLRFEQPALAGSGLPSRWVYLGDDPNGVALEVMAVEQESVDLLVIHAMPLRSRFRGLYEEAAKWRR